MGGPLDSVFSKKFDTLFESDFHDWIFAFEGDERILLVDCFELVSISFCQLGEDEGQKLSEIFEDFEVMFLY